MLEIDSSQNLEIAVCLLS